MFCSFSYLALCSVAICFSCLLSECCPLCVMFLDRNIFCLLFLLLFFFLICLFYYTPQGFACVFSFLFGQPVLTFLDIKDTLSSLRNIFRALKFLNDVDNFLFCTQTSPRPCGVWKHRTDFFFLCVDFGLEGQKRSGKWSDFSNSLPSTFLSNVWMSK